MQQIEIYLLHAFFLEEGRNRLLTKKGSISTYKSGEIVMLKFFVKRLALPLAALASFSPGTKAAVIPVVNGNNDGAGSLRFALTAAQNNDIISFQGAFTVQLQTSLTIDKRVAIVGVAGVRIMRAAGRPGFTMLRINDFLPNTADIQLQNLIFDGGDVSEGVGINNNYPNVEITNCIFEQHFGRALISNTSGGHIKIKKCIFRNNEGISASAFRNIAGSATLDECDFLENRSTAAGVCIAGESGQITITRSTIRGNSASSGTGIAVVNTIVSIVNSTITGNRATASGAGIYLGTNSSLTLHSSTIAGNAAPTGGGIHQLNTSMLSMTNSICWGNSAALLAEAGATTQVSYSIVQGGFADAGNLDANPLFITPVSLANPNPETGGNFQLQTCSPAINAGTATNAPTVDLTGATRPKLGGLYDMGAFESATMGSTGIVYVWPAATGSSNGSSWANAFTHLQYALAFARSCPQVRQIWVAQGTYTPAISSGNRDSAFAMVNNVAIYGGFAGTETELSQRKPRLNPTILSGDIGTLGSFTDNSYNIIANNNNGLNATAVLDGFTLRDGYAYKATYVGSRGAAMFNLNSSPTVRNCTFTTNIATAYGGAVFNEGASATPTFINCVFSGNQAAFGGGIYNESAQTQVINCTFVANLISGNGGGMYSYGTPKAVVRNSIFWGNLPNGIVTAQIDNSTPIEVSYSLVQGGYNGTAILNADPRFNYEPVPGIGEPGDLGLLYCSPAINAGSTAAIPPGIATDIAGFSRVAGFSVDCGAYERSTGIGLDIYVDANAKGTNDGSSWENAFTSLRAALNDLNFCSEGAALTVHVATGTYRFPLQVNAIINNMNGRILGGYPTGGGIRNAVANPVVVRGIMVVMKNVIIDGVQILPVNN